MMQEFNDAHMIDYTVYTIEFETAFRLWIEMHVLKLDWTQQQMPDKKGDNFTFIHKHLELSFVDKHANQLRQNVR